MEEDKENNPSGGMELVLNEVKTHGAIVKIVFDDFLTYDHVIINPGPFLNVIIGPNGTGKSTIICGICLAVGGSPKILGRSDQVGDFIKHGKETGYVEIFLYDKTIKSCNKFRVTITRPNSARYSVNGKPVLRDEHCRQIAKYNIQVDNPCTFLAQDKVKSFAEQDTKQLLKNTEKAGPVELLQMHGELERFFAQGETIRCGLQENRKRFEVIQQNLRTLKGRVDNFKERERRHFKINLLKKRKALFAYEKCVSCQKAAMKIINSAKADFDEANNALAPLRKKIDRIESLSTKVEKAAQSAKARQNDNSRKISETLQSRSFEDKMSDNAAEFAQMKKQFSTWESEKAKIGEEAESLNNLLEKAKSECNEPTEDFQQRNNEIMQKSQQLKVKQGELYQEQNKLQSNYENLCKLNDHQRQSFTNKLQTLAQYSRNRGVIDAWEFYEKNRQQFRCPVYVPFLHMYVGHEKNLIYLNNTIGNRDMGIFIFGCRDDEELLLGGGNRFKINSTVVNEAFCEQYSTPRHIPDNLKSMGFIEFVSELFQSPLPVRAYLCSVFLLDTIPIGGQNVDDSAEEIAQRIGRHFGLFLTGKSRINVIFSKYTNASYVKRSSLNSNGLLRYDQTQKVVDYSADIAAIRDALKQNEQQLQQHDSEKNEFRKEYEELRKQEKIIHEKKQNVIVLEQKLARIRNRLQEFSRKKPDIELASRAFEERKRLLANEAVHNLESLADALESQRICLRDAALSAEEYSLNRNKLRELREEFNTLESKSAQFERVYNEKVHESEHIRADVCAKKKDFMVICDMTLPHDGNIINAEFTSKEKAILKKLKEEFKEYEIPDDLTAVEQQICEEYNRFEIGRLDGSRMDVEDYERFQEESKTIEAQITGAQSIKDKWDHDMDTKLNAWLDPLKVLIEKINVNYASFFERLGCAGNIELKIADDKYNINEYGIVIWVKYRNDAQLRPLTHQTQSGGERSVATMLYLMALQDLCPVPFRCVDEINQGMDPDNERRVFNMMVQLLSASGEVGKTQYFLLTPKLLGGLEFNDGVAVHVVHNGPTMDNIEHWDPEKFLRGQA